MRYRQKMKDKYFLMNYFEYSNRISRDDALTIFKKF